MAAISKFIRIVRKLEPGTSYDPVLRAAERAERQYFFKASAFIRTVARRSFGRPSKKRPRPASAPGKPPRSQTGQLKRSILFAVEKTKAVIGAAGSGFGKSKTAPRALELGGRSVYFAGGRKRTAQYDKRPFMSPALRVAEPKLPSMWANAVNRSSRSKSKG